MDDKEKEKFGVIIDKQNQSESEQPKVEEKSPENKNIESEQPKVEEQSPENEILKTENENTGVSDVKQVENENKTENIPQNQVKSSDNDTNDNLSSAEPANLNENINNNENNDAELTNKENNIEEEKKDHQVIHKKDGRLHIYVRQDKYKGELKSKNWVGRIYLDGKQKIFSSGTPNLDDAIPILEKWFDDLHAQKEKEQNNNDQTESSDKTKIENTQSEQIKETISPNIETTTLQNENNENLKSNLENISTTNQNNQNEDQKSNVTTSLLDKLKSIKLKKPEFGKKDSTKLSGGKSISDIKNKLGGFFKSKIGKSSVQGEEIVGVELTNKEIRLAQITSNKANQWILEKFYTHKVELPEDASVLDNADKMGEELSLAIQKSKITTPNAAIAIPVTSAIIRVVTAPLMTDEELQKAIDTNSLWENLVQLTDNLDDYSIFHQVINKNDKENTMDILFVASKLADINNYTSIIKRSSLNPVIIDVKCFALKSAVDQINQISKNAEDANLTAVLEFGLDENYLMILYENNPIITDIFIRNQDREILQNSQDQEEKEALVRRFITQVKQAVQDFETKYEKRIRNIKVDYLSTFRKSMANVGFNLFDPIDGLKIPQQNVESTNLQNRSYLSTVIGLAFRKLDVFGYYKFVTAVKNINLLPDRADMIKQKKMKAFSKFAFKGVAGAVITIYTLLFGLSFWQIYSYNSKLQDYDKIVKEHKITVKQKKKFSKELGVMTKTLQLSKTLKSNKSLSYRYLAQIAMSVPKRVKFRSVQYDGKKSIILLGSAATDQDILKLINNLNSQKLVQQASLGSMNLPKSRAGSNARKGFKILVKVKG